MRFCAFILAADNGFATVGVLILLVLGIVGAILALTQAVGPKRTGPVKGGTYESGVDPIGDTRRRFNVRFYIVAMLFLLFDVEIVFFYPWATLFPQLTAPTGPAQSAWSQAMLKGGYGASLMLVEMAVFVAILAIGYVYAWRRGAFKWS